MRKYRGYLLLFVITLAIGLAPLWGGIIPGFRSILDVLPETLQDDIPWAALLMSAAAVCVVFFGGETIDARRLTRDFLVAFGALVLVTFAFSFAYSATVIRVRVPGAKTTVAYLVGATLLPSCECAKRALDIRECIGHAISVNPDGVAACYPLREIRTRKAILSALYILLMLLLGTLIGLLVLRSRALPSSSADLPHAGTTPMPAAVFISYATPDWERAKSIYDRLKERWDCWMASEDIPAGGDWPAFIYEAITQSKVFVLILSASATASPEVKRELELARKRGLPILPFALEETEFTPAFAYYLATIQQLRAHEMSAQDALDLLQTHVSRHVAPRAIATLRPPLASGS